MKNLKLISIVIILSLLLLDTQTIIAATSIQQNIPVTGKITDVKGVPVIGVTVSIKGTTIGTITDENGTYSLTVPDNQSLLVYSCIGYEKQEKRIGTRSKMNIVLSENSKALDEVVVVGYGTQKKVNLTGAVASIDFTKQNESRPLTNVSTALSGLSPGVQISQGSGKPGEDGASITIRGVGTTNNTAPLVMVDGIQGNIDDVNPQDIQNISILKDAAASSIYGSQAANGVILITTKSGKNGKININYSGRVSYAQPTNLVKMISNYADYMSLMNESYNNMGQNPLFAQSTIDLWREKSMHPDEVNDLGVPNDVAYPNTNWEKVLFRHGIINQHDLSVSGGSKKVHFRLSAGFMDNPGIVDNTGAKRYNLRTNVEAKITKWLTAGMRTYGYMLNKKPGNFSDANNFLRQTTPGIYPEWHGLWGYPEAPEESATANNLLSKLNDTDGTWNRYRINTTLYTKVSILKNLEWDFNLNYHHYWDESRSWEKSRDQVKFSTGKVITKATQPSQMSTSFSNSSESAYTLENILRYNTTINKDHDLGILLGYQEFYRYNESLAAQKKGLIDPSIHVPSSATEMKSITGTATDYATRSFFGRVNYAYKSRYLFEADMRSDGSSRYDKNHRWGYFPSFSAGWRISEESFMKNTRSFLDNLKIRASWGQLGNMGGDQVGNYEYQATYDLVPYSFNNIQSDGLAITGLANTLLSWETTTSTNFGIDMNSLHNRLSLTVDLYDKYTSGILYRPNIYLTMGHKTAPRMNIAEIENRGIEFSLGWSDHIGQVQYTVTGNFSYNQNRVMKYKGEYNAGWIIGPDGKPIYSNNIGQVSTGSTSRIVEGKMMNEYYLLTPYKGNGHHFNADGTVNKNGGPKDGMIRTKSDLDWARAMIDAGYELRPNKKIGKDKIWYGDHIYADNNGDGIYGGADDDQFTGESDEPKYNFGLQLSAAWHGFDLSMNWSGDAGFKRYWAPTTGYNSTSTRAGIGLSEMIADDHYFYDPDHPDDPRTNINSKYPRLTAGESGSQNDEASTFFLYNANYLKLRNLTFGYTIPKKILKSAFIQSARVYFSGENLLTITSFPGQDPEMSANPGYISLRQFAFGVNLSF